MSSAALYYAGSEENSHQPHFLEACSLCQKPLGHNSDIFMYRGDTPFCSQECRQEQIEIDQAKERRFSSSSSKRALRQRTTAAEPTKKPSSPNKGVRTGTVAVA